ncbi:MAG TPA: tRNA threonylcarbamoyladenosine dehydratase [Prolixibacteraceae bacterium]|nr:tRNA threonylcarbamoyladenosine dehydratase [Prolixibacteraceae bacterium]HOS01406.1 tRNA threonylcarbamoyladenosine dehydratase [Prolixibacteraceae bacterium]HPL46524.1 tRNA threonylcarbamoyladenosine dehydratase [Prolixibacteraceae bacterium]
MNREERTRLLLGDERIARLATSHVLVVGLGGVGAYAAEMLCRAGVGELTIVDGDIIEESNLNRQLPALLSTIGKPKTEVMASRLLDINPKLKLSALQEYLRDERTSEVLGSAPFDYVVDCIDTLSPKIFLIYHAVKLGYRVISSMGSGGKMDPSLVAVADISKTHDCKLARMVRKRLRRLGISSGVKAVYSPEEVPESAIRPEEGVNKNSTVGTISYMPPLFGCFLAGEVIRDLTG